MLITWWYLYLAARSFIGQCKYCWCFCVWPYVVSRWTLCKERTRETEPNTFLSESRSLSSYLLEREIMHSLVCCKWSKCLRSGFLLCHCDVCQACVRNPSAVWLIYELCACEAARRTICYCRVCVQCFAASPDPKHSSLSSFIYTSQHWKWLQSCRNWSHRCLVVHLSLRGIKLQWWVWARLAWPVLSASYSG